MLGGASGGYCAIGIVGIAMSPARMMTSEQTDARIGRRMKVLTNTLLRLHRRAVRDLLDAGRDQLIARLQPALDNVVVALDVADRQRPLPCDESLRPRLGDEAEVLAVDAVDGRDRHHQA